MSNQTTRSWDVGYDAQLAAALDAHAAGLATEVHVSRYSSFMRPVVARSVCTLRVRAFGTDGSPCPRFDQLFVRNMHVLRQYAAKYECMQQQVPKDHPCKHVGSRKCRESFVRGMAALQSNATPGWRRSVSRSGETARRRGSKVEQI